MSNLKVFTVFALAVILAGAADAAPGRGGGGGGGGRVGGGAAMPHGFGGGGGMPHGFGGGGGMPHGIGGGGVPHVMGGGHFGGAPRFSRGPGISHFAARPSFHDQRSFAVPGNRLAGRGPAFHVNRSASFSRNAARLSTNRLNTNRSANARSDAVRNALNSRAVSGALHNRAALVSPNTRAQIAATAATAGWHDGRVGWWRHRNGGYGWVGPLFWPFAYYDIYDYALWGYGYDDPFWDYGYGDIYAGIFSPYDYNDLAGYWQQAGNGNRVSARRTEIARTATPDQLAQMCGEDSRDIAGLPIDQIQQAIEPNDAQRAALDDLANASVKAAQDIKAACPTQIASTAPGRLTAMQQRIEAMIAAVETVQPPLEKFYDLLNDEQKSRLNALAQDQRRARTARSANHSLAQSCGAEQAAAMNWPSAEIEARLHPTEAQRASLTALQDATAKAADMLKTSCPTTEPIIPTARLEAIRNRLETMLQAVKSVRAALGDFYGKLSDEQKAQFEAIGPGRERPFKQSSATYSDIRRHHVSIGGLVRHFISMARW
jgi:LTXXQ motif family protein